MILLGFLLSRVSMANYKTDRNISCPLELSHTLILSVKFKGAQAGSVGFKLDRPRLKCKLALSLSFSVLLRKWA